MTERDLMFILLLGFALGVGKVAGRLQNRDLALLLAVTVVASPLAILAYSLAFGMSMVLALTWFALCVFVGAVSGHYSHAHQKGIQGES
ncbi:MAG: hypothetical protein HYX94_01760 [Chloroflexi bacterium]|nr:hypothetical protein [Chloroflexota bacterium]